MDLFTNATIQAHILNNPETMSIGGCGPIGEGDSEAFKFDDLGGNTDAELIGMGEGEELDNEPIMVSFSISGAGFDDFNEFDDDEEEITWGGCEQLLAQTHGKGLADFIIQQSNSSSSHNLSSFVQSIN